MQHAQSTGVDTASLHVRAGRRVPPRLRVPHLRFFARSAQNLGPRAAREQKSKAIDAV